jgi:hypothetical protein
MNFIRLFIVLSFFFIACGSASVNDTEVEESSTVLDPSIEKNLISDSIYIRRMDSIQQVMNTYRKVNLVEYYNYVLEDSMFTVKMFFHFADYIAADSMVIFNKERFHQLLSEDDKIQKMVLTVPVRFFATFRFLKQIEVKAASNAYIYEGKFERQALRNYLDKDFEVMRRDQYKKSFRKPFLDDKEKRKEFLKHFVQRSVR